ncbi:N-acetylmuramoyl-L-alanine amidase family protein [Geothrix fuzhouensis]|uniref:N-acetylmuramoyl-L-alanine amidase family protein n=1 Tax=Geothrix fuzhouensis TaxID=2966451 RepID=UPI002148EECF|nr:N-acetylmuramoyl-L-alanine amidase [Geothrix fuzhouensis]
MIRLLSLLLTFSLLSWAQSPKPTGPPVHPPRLKVMVDPGHGGDDSGAKGPKGLKEKAAALEIGRAVAAKLEAAGFEAVFTRDDDTFIPLWDRARAANAQGADLFISLHLNAARTRAARGSEVYFLSLGKGDDEEVVAVENAGAGAAPAGADSVVASILDDLAQKAFLQDSERLAVAIQGQLNRLAGIKERGVKQAPFIVLRGAAMPAVLVEVAFISNLKEEAKLKDAAFRAKVADAITRGVRRYFAQANGSVRRRTVAGPS